MKRRTTNKSFIVTKKETKKKEVRFQFEESEQGSISENEEEYYEDPNSPSVFFKKYHEDINREAELFKKAKEAKMRAAN